MFRIETVQIIVVLFFGLYIYFLPCLIAKTRRHENTLAIFVLNLLAGWTLIGWAGAMVWAFIAQKQEVKEVQNA